MNNEKSMREIDIDDFQTQLYIIHYLFFSQPIREEGKAFLFGEGCRGKKKIYTAYGGVNYVLCLHIKV